MKSLSTLLVTILLVLSIESLQAQKFNERYAGFSKSKLSYIETEDGNKVEGYLKGLAKDEGLITSVKLKDTNDKILEFTTSQVKKVYLFPSSASKIQGILAQDDVINSWGDESLIDTVLIKEGYVLFEKTPIQIEGKGKNELKTKEVFLQLVNPHFSKQIKVYDNPNTDNSGLINVGGIKLAGGGINSYYIRKISEKEAYKLYSWDYRKKFNDIFGESQTFIEKYGKVPAWFNFERDVYQFTLLKKK
jgi:hypothetical protein